MYSFRHRKLLSVLFLLLLFGAAFIHPSQTAQAEHLSSAAITKSGQSRYSLKSKTNDLIEIGTDTKSQTDQQPFLKLTKWAGETSLKVSIPVNVNTSPLTHTNEKLVYPAKDGRAVEFLSKPPEQKKTQGHPGNFTVNEEGGVEFNIILNKKPASNRFEFPLEGEDLDYYYQPPLNVENRDPSLSCTETACTDRQGRTILQRPEHAIHSYAVYYRNKTGDYTQIGGKNYRSGKAFHIYRPEVMDDSGRKVWGELNVNKEGSLLTLTVPWEFLNSAAYPVLVDPTFGYTTAGASTASTYRLYSCSLFTGSPGTLDKMTVSIDDVSGLADLAYRTTAVYRHSDLSLVAQSNTRMGDSDWTQHWTDFDFNSEAISNEDYLLCFIFYSGGMGTFPSIYYDSGSANQGHTAVYPGPHATPLVIANTFPAVTHNNYKFSFYATYTAVATGSTLAAPPSLSTVLAASENTDVSTTPQTGTQLVRLRKGSIPIVDVTTDFSVSRDWSSVTADSDTSARKSYVHFTGANLGVGTTHTIYVPRIASDNPSLRYCPNALSLSQVTSNCAGGDTFSGTFPQTKTVGSESINVSQTTINGLPVWKIDGVTGSGGQDLTIPGTYEDELSSSQLSFFARLASDNAATNNYIKIGTSAPSLTTSNLFVGDTIAVANNNGTQLNLYNVTDISTNNSFTINSGLLSDNHITGNAVIATRSAVHTIRFVPTDTIPGGIWQFLLKATSLSGETPNDGIPDQGGFDLGGDTPAATTGPGTRLKTADISCPFGTASVGTTAVISSVTYHVISCSLGVGETNPLNVGVSITIGRQLSSGSQLINPTRSTSHTYGVGDISKYYLRQLDSSGNVVNLYPGNIPLNESVRVSVSIDPFITFSISTTGVGVGSTPCGFSPLTHSAAPISVVFPSLQLSSFNNLAQRLSAVTNASSGYIVTVYQSVPLTNSNTGATLPDTNCDTGCTPTSPGAWVSNTTSSGFGYSIQNLSVGTTVFNYNQGSSFNAKPFGTGPVNAQAIMRHTSRPLTTEEANMCYRVTSSTSQPAATYQNHLIFTATAVF